MKRLQRTFALILVIALCSPLIATVFASGEINPRYNNTISVKTTATVSSSGLLVVRHRLNGIEGVTARTEITTYVEKSILGLIWVPVDIGTEDNCWYIHVGSYYYDGTRQCQLTSTGTYRITSTYVVTGTGGAADTITSTCQVTY